ncbi:MAG: sel1 repeat family protein [Firmicutes bacterium]|nr:sel1 repeat family protein [Bacillota bacterium]
MLDSTIKLESFLFKYVDVIDTDGKRYDHWYVDIYESAADNDDTEECIGFGEYCEAPVGVCLNRSEIESIKLSENQTENSQDIEYLNAGAAAYQQGDYETAVKLYKKAAAMGNVTALSNLGYCYYYGRSIPVDKDMAKKFREQAAIFGDIAAIYKLGDMYRFGDLKKSIEYSNALYCRAFELSLESEDIYVYPDAILRMLQYCPEILDKGEFDKTELAKHCVEGIRERIEDGDNYSGKVLQKAEAILNRLEHEQDSDSSLK